MNNETRPNLFHWATSELSQDAFLAWLISWADPKYQSIDPDLNYCALQFVCSLLPNKTNLNIQTIEVKRQWENIDILVIINQQEIIIIEDKTFSSEHSNQLERYAQKVQIKYNKEHIHKVYFKMHEQGNYSKVNAAGFIRYT